MINKIDKFRLIVSSCKQARDNMAEDEALLKNFCENDMPILRLYSWKENSITIGISQKIEEYTNLQSKENKIAKRVTGGGVLFHGHDVSYSLIIPTKVLNTLSVKESYEEICTFLINFYKKLGLSVCYAKDSKDITLSKSEYCQVGFEAYDIIANGKKIGGNAQRRSKKAIFQHGSIPVRFTKSNTFDERIGITLENLNINLEFDGVIENLSESFSTTFDVELIESKLTNKEIELKNSLLKEKYDKTC